MAFALLGDGAHGPTTAGLAAFGGVVGTATVGSHVAVDGLTPMGIAPLSPLRRRRVTLDVTPSASPRANRLALLGGAAAFALAIVLTAPVPLGR